MAKQGCSVWNALVRGSGLANDLLLGTGKVLDELYFLQRLIPSERQGT